MNLVIIPFHDWRKILLEGFRTRDAHFIEELSKNDQNINIIVNRPTTILEILLKRKRNLINGEVIFKSNGFKLYKLKNNLYLIDNISSDIFGQILFGYKWFIKKYSNKKYSRFIEKCLTELNIENKFCAISQNIFAHGLINNLNPDKRVFDAWDNFTKFNVYSKIINQINIAYQNYAKICDFWTTNSKDNITDFSEKFSPKKMYLIKNGVDVSRFSKSSNSAVPKDLINIPRPIVGFGGKITHLIDVELLNETMLKSKESSFVFVGQILNKEIYDKILKLDNFYYLGDKHYDEYPEYVMNFDICIVPYIVDDKKKSGANTIKVYEYLATNKKVIGTKSNGLEDLQNYVYIINNSDDFCNEIKDQFNDKPKIDLNAHSWDQKTKELLQILNG